MRQAEKDFAGLRVKLADAANKRLASRKRKDPALAGRYDGLILAMLSVFDAYDKSRPFYERGVRVDYKTLVSVVMDRMGIDVPDPDHCAPPGALELWNELIHTPLEERAKCPPTAEQRAALIETTHALEDLLYEISGESERRRFDYISEEWWTKNGSYGFHWLFWDLLFLTTAVNIREIDNFFRYPETWGYVITDGGANPISFMFDGSLDDYRKMWESVKAKFHSCNPTWPLGMCDHYLPLEAVDYPLAFCFGNPEQALHRVGHTVARALVIYQDLKFDYDNETVMWDPGMTVTRAAYQIRWKVVDYFRRARSKCKASSPAHRKWLEVEAELIAHCGVESDPITHEVADRIVALANDAAREMWIEARSVSNSDKMDSTLDALLRQPISVTLSDVAPSAGKSLRAAMKDPGGRPTRTEGGAKVLSQAEMAVAFGVPCNEAMVANWEARAAGKKRGANPPDAVYNGLKIIYSAELRTNPTPENKKRLTALISEFQSRHRLKTAIGEKAKTIHCRSAESLYQAQKKHGA